MMADIDFKDACAKDLEVALENIDLVALKETFTNMFPISELYIKDKYIKDFIKIYCFYNKSAKETVDKFISIYTEYGFMGLRTNVEILGDELDKDYKNNDTKDLDNYEKWIDTSAAVAYIESYRQ